MNKYWFKPKAYGYGFTPASWEGWLATAGLVGAILLSAYSNSFFDEIVTTPKDIAQFFVDLIILVCVSIVLFKDKTTQDMGWRWGKK